MRLRRDLVRALASYYPTEGEARMMVGFTELPIIDIDISGSARVMWNNIIKRAILDPKEYCSLLEIVLEDYDDETIKQVIASIKLDGQDQFTGNVGSLGKSDNEEYIPFQNILKLIDRNKFGPLRRVDCNRTEQFSSFVNFSSGKPYTITYVLGKMEDNPQSFPERVILDRMKNYPTDVVRRYISRRKGEERHDEIPFDIHPDLDTSKNVFKTEFELLNHGFHFEGDKLIANAVDQKVDYCAYAINFNYSEGKHILTAFTKWIYQVFNSVPDCIFQIFFVFRGVDKNFISIKKEIEVAVNKLQVDPLMHISLHHPVDYYDIKDWQAKIGAELYEDGDFERDLKASGVSVNNLTEFQETKKISINQFERFQNKLYNEVLKK